MAQKIIILPNGKACGIGRYLKAWQALKALPGHENVNGFHWFPDSAANILREMRAGLHDRINRHDAAYGKGRKWAEQYQTGMHRDAHRIQQIHQRVRHYQFESIEARARFSHLLSSHED